MHAHTEILKLSLPITDIHIVSINFIICNTKKKIKFQNMQFAMYHNLFHNKITFTDFMQFSVCLFFFRIRFTFHSKEDDKSTKCQG